jgi:hypothetical protein
LEKVKMSSAKLFSFSILEAGRNCNMWKFDFEDAYKNIPVCTYQPVKCPRFLLAGQIFC